MHDDDGRVMKRGGKPLPMVTPPPCHSCPKIPYGEPADRAHAEDMSDRNRLAYYHWLECRAVNVWPDDPLVRRNARIIREVYDRWERQPLKKILDFLHGFTR
jgi:hypothetical protein